MKQPKEFDYFKGWLLFFVIVIVANYVISIVIGSFLAAFMGAGGASFVQMGRVVQLASFVISIPISYVTFRGVVGKYLFPKLEED